MRATALAIAATALAAALPALAQPYPPDAGYRGPDDRGYPGDGPGDPRWGGGHGGRVTCQSWQYRYQECPLPGRGRPAIVQRLGGTCVEGRTWGVRRGMLWVDKGCRAVFAGGRGGWDGGPGPGPGPGWGGRPQTVICQSWKYAYAECPVEGRRAEVEQVLGGQCVEGRTWGLRGRGLWVDQGCRARFRVY